MPWAAGARSNYVAPGGSDAATGTVDQPYLTIQKAAAVAESGDTIYIRAGACRETVTPKNSGVSNAPITFTSYNGEPVTVSGAYLIDPSSWSLSTGSIYQATMPWDQGAGGNQVFLDGQMMIEARWPNTTPDLSHPVTGIHRFCIVRGRRSRSFHGHDH